MPKVELLKNIENKSINISGFPEGKNLRQIQHDKIVSQMKDFARLCALTYILELVTGVNKELFLGISLVLIMGFNQLQVADKPVVDTVGHSRNPKWVGSGSMLLVDKSDHIKPNDLTHRIELNHLRLSMALSEGKLLKDSHWSKEVKSVLGKKTPILECLFNSILQYEPLRIADELVEQLQYKLVDVFKEKKYVEGKQTANSKYLTDKNSVCVFQKNKKDFSKSKKKALELFKEMDDITLKAIKYAQEQMCHIGEFDFSGYEEADNLLMELYDIARFIKTQKKSIEFMPYKKY